MVPAPGPLEKARRCRTLNRRSKLDDWECGNDGPGGVVASTMTHVFFSTGNPVGSGYRVQWASGSPLLDLYLSSFSGGLQQSPGESLGSLNKTGDAFEMSEEALSFTVNSLINSGSR